MKVIKPFFLWALSGSALALTLTVALYFSPLREFAYFRADPEMASIRTKLDKYQEWLSHTDLRLATVGGENSDSLRSAQTKAWRDYKGWRTRLGELARAHAEPSAAGFWPWMHSLRFWILPFLAFLALVPGGIAAWRAYFLFRPGRAKPGKTKPGPAKPGSHAARSQALSSFEEAIQKVAKISKADQGAARLPDRPAIPRAVRPADQADGKLPDRLANQRPDHPGDTSTVPPAPPAQPMAPAPRPRVVGLQSKDPETEFLPVSSLLPPQNPRTDTRYMQIGANWGEPLDLSGNPPPGEANFPASLSMEDEDAGDASRDTDESSGSGTLGIMPPTTEVERVERRKDEVLKLARKGMTSSEISRRLRISQDQVEFIIRLRREKG